MGKLHRIFRVKTAKYLYKSTPRLMLARTLSTKADTRTLAPLPEGVEGTYQ